MDTILEEEKENFIENDNDPCFYHIEQGQVVIYAGNKYNMELNPEAYL